MLIAAHVSASVRRDTALKACMHHVCVCADIALLSPFAFLSSCNVCVGVPWRDMADDGTVDDEGHDNFYYVLNNVIKGNHLPCPKSVTPLLPELPEVLTVS